MKIEWIISILSNDEYSSDQELIEHFMSEGLSEKEAREWVEKRNFYLNNIVLKYE